MPTVFKTILPYIDELIRPELPLVVGRQNRSVKRVQEWINHWGIKIACDGDFGPATLAAVKRVQASVGVPPDQRDGVVTLDLWNELVAPLRRATAIDVDPHDSFGQAVMRFARRFLAERPREIGGNNRGPWQRHFSRGREGQPWCQDFASTPWLLTAYYRKLPLAFALIPEPDMLGDNEPPSSYVPWVVESARRAGKLVETEDAKQPIPIGSMFFRRGMVEGRWSHDHVGLVAADHGDVIETIEGNTSAGGSVDGDGVMAGLRKRATCDYGVWT